MPGLNINLNLVVSFQVLLVCLVAASAAAPQQAQKEPVAILAQESNASPDGSFHYL